MGAWPGNRPFFVALGARRQRGHDAVEQPVVGGAVDQVFLRRAMVPQEAGEDVRVARREVVGPLAVGARQCEVFPAVQRLQLPLAAAVAVRAAAQQGDQVLDGQLRLHPVPRAMAEYTGDHDREALRCRCRR